MPTPITMSSSTCAGGSLFKLKYSETLYKDHLREEQNVVLIHRWSLYAGSIIWKVYLWGPVKCGLYIQVAFRAGLTGTCKMISLLS